MSGARTDLLKRLPPNGRAAVRACVFGAGVAFQIMGAVSNGWLWLAGIAITALSFLGLSDAA